MGGKWLRFSAVWLAGVSLVFAAACAAPASPGLAPQTPADPQPVLPGEQKVITQEEAQQVALDFVRHEATFRFDGIGSTLKLAKASGDRIAGRWEFEYDYQSRQAGYGDRTGMILAQVITDHRAKIIVEQGRVTYAVLDGKWDMLRQEMLP